MITKKNRKQNKEEIKIYKKKGDDVFTKIYIYIYGEHDDEGAMVGIKFRESSQTRALGCPQT